MDTPISVDDSFEYRSRCRVESRTYASGFIEIWMDVGRFREYRMFNLDSDPHPLAGIVDY